MPFRFGSAYGAKSHPVPHPLHQPGSRFGMAPRRTSAHHISCGTRCTELADAHDDSASLGCPSLANRSGSAKGPTIRQLANVLRTRPRRDGRAQSSGGGLETFVAAPLLGGRGACA